MKRWLKTLFKKPFTEAELTLASDHLIKNPPLPPELHDAMAGIMNSDGRVSLLDYWRNVYRQALANVAAEPTWETQRRNLLSTIMTEVSWRSLEVVANGSRHVEAWRHMTNGIKGFDGATAKNLGYLRHQRYLIAILNEACLSEVGMKLYRVSTSTRLEMGLCHEYDMEILKLDAGILDIILDHVDAYEDEDALVAADLKEAQIDPVIKEQFALLARMKDSVLSGTFDIATTKLRIDAMDAKKAELAALLARRRNDAP